MTPAIGTSHREPRPRWERHQRQDRLFLRAGGPSIKLQRGLPERPAPSVSPLVTSAFESRQVELVETFRVVTMPPTGRTGSKIAMLNDMSLGSSLKRSEPRSSL